MLNYFRHVISLVLMLLGLIGLVGNTVTWYGFMSEIVEHYHFARDWLFGWLPFFLADGVKDYLILSLAFASSYGRGLLEGTTEISERNQREYYKTFPDRKMWLEISESKNSKINFGEIVKVGCLLLLVALIFLIACLFWPLILAGSIGKWLDYYRSRGWEGGRVTV